MLDAEVASTLQDSGYRFNRDSRCYSVCADASDDPGASYSSEYIAEELGIPLDDLSRWEAELISQPADLPSREDSLAIAAGERNAQDDGFRALWRLTWEKWQSGTLAPISDRYSKVEADDFTRNFIHNPLIKAFFKTHLPRPGEFYISMSEQRHPIEMLMTNQRLWLLDRRRGDYACVEFSDVSQMRSVVSGNSARLTVTLRNGEECTYEGDGAVPSDKAVQEVIRRCGSPDGWTTSPAATEPATRVLGRDIHNAAIAGVIAGFVSHYLTNGHLTIAVWIVGYIAAIAFVKHRLAATIVFALICGLILTLLRGTSS